MVNGVIDRYELLKLNTFKSDFFLVFFRKRDKPYILNYLHKHVIIRRKKKQYYFLTQEV